MLWAMARLQLGRRYPAFTRQLLVRLMPPGPIQPMPPGPMQQGGTGVGSSSSCGPPGPVQQGGSGVGSSSSRGADQLPGHDRRQSSSRRSARPVPASAQSLAACGNAIDVSNTAWAFARLLLEKACPAFHGAMYDSPTSGGGIPTGSWPVPWSDVHHACRHLHSAASRTAPHMGPEEVSITAWAVASIAAMTARAGGGEDDEEQCDADEGEGGAPLSSPGEEDGIDLLRPPSGLRPLLCSFFSDDVLGHRATHLASSCAYSRQQAPSLAWACARLEHRGKPLLDALAECTLRQLPNLTAQGLSMTLWAYARLGYRHPALIAGVARAATWKARKFTGRGLSNLAWALSEFRCVCCAVCVCVCMPTDTLAPQQIVSQCRLKGD